jgi:DNA-binding transcriptional LysR family regulator
LLAQVEGPLAALDSAAEGIKHLGKWGHTQLRIGAAHTACEHILPRVIRELKKNQHSLELRLESADTPQLIELLQQSKVDLVLGLAPASQTGLAVRPMFRDELMFVFSPAHAWADGRPITRDEILKQQLIVYQRSSFTAQLVDSHFRELGMQPSIAMEVASTTAIIEFVKLNLGVAIMAPWTVDRELSRGVLKTRPLASKALCRRWSITSLANHRMSLVEETFCRLCRNHATGMRLDRSDLPPFEPVEPGHT